MKPNGDISEYRVTTELIRLGSNKKRQTSPVKVVSGTNATITGLVSQAQYSITVQPFANRVGGEKVSDTTVVNTTVPVPQLPYDSANPFDISVTLPRPSLYGSVV